MTPTDLPDGLYAVVEDRWAAGFVVEHGEVTMCAPILRKRLGYWLGRAREVDVDTVATVPRMGATFCRWCKAVIHRDPIDPRPEPDGPIRHVHADGGRVQCRDGQHDAEPDA